MFNDTRVAVHVALTAIMAWLAFVLILPGDTFAGSKTFDVMARLGDENHWAMAFWSVATIGLIGLTTMSTALRFCSVMIVATTHGVVALCFVAANPLNTGTGTYSIIALLGYFLCWRRSRDGIR